MNIIKPRDPNYIERVKNSFARQIVMATIGAELLEIIPGRVTIGLPYRADLTQQDGYLHAGITTTIVDSACGYAALSLMAPGREVLSVEFKVNMLAPATGAFFRATGEVLKSGKTLTICRGEVVAVIDEEIRLVAAMQATMIAR